MEDIILISISKKELESLIEQVIRRVLNEGEPLHPEGDMLLSAKETSIFLKIAPATLYEYTRNQKIPHSKMGKRLYFSKNDLMAWIKGGKRQTHSETEAEAINYLNRGRKNRLILP
jgi:hypothetical protein